MSKMTLDQMIAVLQEAKAGKQIQARHSQDYGPCAKWKNVTPQGWNFVDLEYRVAPEPLVIWVNQFSSGLSNQNHHSRSAASASMGGSSTAKTLKFVQVMDDTE